MREAIRLAVKLHNQQGGGQPGNGGYGMPPAPMSAWGVVSAAPGAPKGCSMMQRLQDLEGLVSRGVLARGEADGLKVRQGQQAGSNCAHDALEVINSILLDGVGDSLGGVTLPHNDGAKKGSNCWL